MGSATVLSIIMLTSAPVGTGKTYVRCGRFVPVFFRDGGKRHISNFPIRRDAMRVYLAERGYVKEEEFDSRVVELPRGVLHDWEQERKGPWEYFRDVDLSGCHIAIDEAHNFVGCDQSRAWRKLWASWLSEIRHRGATIEFISQDPSRLAVEVLKLAGKRLSLVTSGDRRDPYLHIPLSDWYELFAKVRGRYLSFVWCVERQKNDGQWQVTHEDRFLLESQYFALYDSYSKPVLGGTAAADTKREWEKRSWGSLLKWFAQRNADKLLIRGALVAVLVWLLCFGGIGCVMGKLVDGTMGIVSKQVAGALGTGRGSAGIASATRPASRPVVVSRVVSVKEYEVGPDGARLLASTQPSTQPVGSDGALPQSVSLRLWLVFPGACVASDGARRGIGDAWDEKATVQGVDLHDRCVVLSDGRRVLLGASAGLPAGGGGFGAAGIFGHYTGRKR